MSKERALKMISKRAVKMMADDCGIDSNGNREDIVLAWQTQHGLKADGWPGDSTMASLWHAHQPDAVSVVDAALAALRWPNVRYSMSENKGMGESWLSDIDAGFSTGDCSDFACYCLGIPKNQTAHRGVIVHHHNPCWLGADAIAGGAIGTPLQLDQSQPGDLVVFSGRWERGERVAIGHVEVCVDVKDGRIWTVGCASSNARTYGRGAIAKADKTARWRRMGAVAVRPWWYQTL